MTVFTDFCNFAKKPNLPLFFVSTLNCETKSNYDYLFAKLCLAHLVGWTNVRRAKIVTDFIIAQNERGKFIL